MPKQNGATPDTGLPSFGKSAMGGSGKKRIVVLGSGELPGHPRCLPAVLCFRPVRTWLNPGLSRLAMQENLFVGAQPSLWAMDPRLFLMHAAATHSCTPRLYSPAAGWAAMSFVKAFDESMKEKYELVLVSVSWLRQGAV